jgi:hypothetical protein
MAAQSGFRWKAWGVGSQSTGGRIQEMGKEKGLIHGVERIRVASSEIFGGIFRKEGLS